MRTVSPIGTLREREALKANEIPLPQAMSSQRRRIERLVVSGNEVAWLTSGGTVLATGKVLETEVCNVLTFDGDRIVEWRAYADYSKVMEA